MRTKVGTRLMFRFAIEKKLFVYDSGVRDGTMDAHRPDLHSGVRATIFGASGTPPSNRHPRPPHRRRTRPRRQQPHHAPLPRPQLQTLRPTQGAARLRTNPYLSPQTDRTWLDYSMNYRDQTQV